MRITKSQSTIDSEVGADEEEVVGKPLCLELYDGKLCASDATHEVTAPLDNLWVAKCENCAMAYTVKKKLSPLRALVHELLQLRAGMETIGQAFPELKHAVIRAK